MLRTAALQVDLLHRRVGTHDLEDILPRHALEIRSKYRKLLDEMVAKYQGSTVKWGGPPEVGGG